MATLQEVEAAFMKAHQAGDEPAARVLAGEVRRLRAAPASSPVTEKAPSVVDEMGTGERVLVGVGSAMTDAWNGLKGLVGAGPSEAELAEKRRIDAPLRDTTAGAVGNALGNVAVAALPAALAGPTVLGAAGAGLLTGAATTPGGIQERAEAGLMGALGGGAGQAAGNAIGRGVTKWAANRASAAAGRQAANAVQDATLAASRDAGYVVPPSMTQSGGAINNMLEALGGKIKTAQVASVKNQKVTNELARKAIGLPDGAPITTEALDAIRSEAGKVYAQIANSGKINATGARLPASVSVEKGMDPLTMTPRTEVDAGEVIRAWRQANADATAWFRAAGRSANPEDLAKARANAADAKAIGKFIEDSFPDLAPQLKEARQLIAKTYSVENALNPSTGNVAGNKLAKALGQGKPLSGELKQAAEFAQAFPKAAQEGVAVPAFSPLDIFSGGLGVGTGNPLLIALTAARPVARGVALNPTYQRAMVNPTYGLGAARAAPVLDNEMVRLLSRSGGAAAGAAYAGQQ